MRDALSQRGWADLEPRREDPSAMLRGLARYQGTDDASVGPQWCVSAVVLAPERLSEPLKTMFGFVD
jgi:hypothetical protein